MFQTAPVFCPISIYEMIISCGRQMAATKARDGQKKTPPMRRADSLEKTLMLGKTEGRRRRGL